MKLNTDFIRVAVEGTTADGRNISGVQIEQMASSYDPSVYDAKIWLEHIRGYTPDGMFKPLGRVTEVKAERISDKSALAGKKALFVKLEPHPDLVAMVRNGQKVHTSIEMHPKFPTTDGAYLMGLGVTDSPASLGTGIMQFSTAARSESVFSDPQALSADDDTNPATDTAPAEHFSKMVDYFTGEINRYRAERDALQAELEKLKTDHAAEVLDLKGQIPADGYTPRPLFTNSEGSLGSPNGWR